MKHRLTVFFVIFMGLIWTGLAGTVSACSTTKNQGQRQLATVSSTPAQTKTFCDNTRHFESFYLCWTAHEIGVDGQLCPVLWAIMPELSPDKLPLAKALAEAIDKDCLKPSGDCQVFNNTCSEEQKQIKQGILNCIVDKVGAFKASKC